MTTERFPLKNLSLKAIGGYFELQRSSLITHGWDARHAYEQWCQYRGTDLGARLHADLCQYNEDDVTTLAALVEALRDTWSSYPTLLVLDMDDLVFPAVVSDIPEEDFADGADLEERQTTGRRGGTVSSVAGGRPRHPRSYGTGIPGAPGAHSA